MVISLLLYLVEASICLAVFALTYRLLLARLSYFAWNRAYLLGALLASLVLPLLTFPVLATLLISRADNEAAIGPMPLLLNWQAGRAAVGPATADETVINWPIIVTAALLGLYGLGMLYKFGSALRNVHALRQLAQQHPQTDMGTFAIVHLPAPDRPAFSFGKYVFLSPLHATLSATERQQLLQHEAVHVSQRHTLDLLLAEVIGGLLWFCGLVPYFQRQLKAVHEYLADEAVARSQPSLVGYGELLIKLSAQQPAFALAHAFSNHQLFLRIQMLTKPTSNPMQKLRFLLVIPAIAFAWAATACIGSPAPENSAASAGTPPSAVLSARIGRITWQGNTVLSTTELNQALGLKPGDAYDSAAVAQRLSYSLDDQDVTSRYMDQGYLFFSLTPTVKRQANGTVDLGFSLAEGRKAELGTITFTGNIKTSTAELLKLLPLRSGDAFSRAKLIEAHRLLAQQGKFDPAKIGINPQPVMRSNQATDLVNIEVVVVEK